MISIGDFARLGQVSVRMLRHYDRIGLLTPARVDPSSGYRSYSARQLARLNRVVALKELGFTLEEVGQFIADDLDLDELRGMLLARQAELAQQHAQAVSRLADVEYRLMLIQQEHDVSHTEHVIKPLPGRRLAALRAEVNTQDQIAAAIGPLFASVSQTLIARAGRPERAVATYEGVVVGDELVLHILAGYDYTGAPAGDAFEIVTLPPVETAVCAVHLGHMQTIADSWRRLFQWLEDHSWRATGGGREVYLHATPLDDQSGWVTELQQPVTTI